MSKPKTEAKRKDGKRQKRGAAPAEPQPKPERCKWDPAYCAKVEALGAEGRSAPEIRKELGIPPSTWRNWVKAHAEFAEAVEQATEAVALLEPAMLPRPSRKRAGGPAINWGATAPSSSRRFATSRSSCRRCTFRSEQISARRGFCRYRHSRRATDAGGQIHSLAFLRPSRE